MINDIARGIEFARSNKFATTWQIFSSPANKHPLVQFAKYFVCGGLATLLYNLIFALTGYTIFPHFESLDVVKSLSIKQRVLNFTLSSGTGFLICNVLTYLMNLKWVFEGGRHSKAKEFLTFTLVSSIGFFVGLLLAILNLTKGTGGSWVAGIALIVTSVIVNFLCRKFIIFKG